MNHTCSIALCFAQTLGEVFSKTALENLKLLRANEQTRYVFISCQQASRVLSALRILLNCPLFCTNFGRGFLKNCPGKSKVVASKRTDALCFYLMSTGVKSSKRIADILSKNCHQLIFLPLDEVCRSLERQLQGATNNLTHRLAPNSYDSSSSLLDFVRGIR